MTNASKTFLQFESLYSTAIFTASSYANRYTNSAAFITVDAELKLQFTVLEPIIPELDLGLELEVEPGPSTGRYENEEYYEGEDLDVQNVELDAQ